MDLIVCFLGLSVIIMGFLPTQARVELIVAQPTVCHSLLPSAMASQPPFRASPAVRPSRASRKKPLDGVPASDWRVGAI